MCFDNLSNAKKASTAPFPFPCLTSLWSLRSLHIFEYLSVEQHWKHLRHFALSRKHMHSKQRVDIKLSALLNVPDFRYMHGFISSSENIYTTK